MIQTIELQTRLTNNFTQIKKTPVFVICIVNDEVQNMIMRDDVQNENLLPQVGTLLFVTTLKNNDKYSLNISHFNTITGNAYNHTLASNSVFKFKGDINR